MTLNRGGRKNYLHVCEPDIGPKEIAYVTDAVKTGHISGMAKYVKLFEEAFAKKMGVKYAVSVNSGGSALFLALWALGIRKGDEVIMPSFTMIATANAVLQCGAKPVFVDSEPNGNIDVSKIEKKITRRTKAIIPVHIYGHPADMDEIMKIARRHRLFVVEDAAESHAARYKGKTVGSFGEAAIYSFFANKLITTGEGGMITTNNPRLAQELIYLRRYYFSPKMHFWHKKLAWNLNMSSLQAALGLAQLERMDELMKKRRANAAYYTRALKELNDHLIFPSEKKGAKSIFWMYGLIIKKPGLRDKLMDWLWQNGVETRTYFFPMHWQPLYRERRGKYPVADWLGKNGLYLPSSSNIKRRDQDRVIGLIKKFFESQKINA